MLLKTTMGREHFDRNQHKVLKNKCWQWIRVSQRVMCVFWLEHGYLQSINHHHLPQDRNELVKPYRHIKQPASLIAPIPIVSHTY